MDNGHDREHIERHERTERLLEAVATEMTLIKDELRAFITSQVLMGENLDKVAKQQRELANEQREQANEQRELAREQRELAKRTDEKFSETNDKLNALITFFEQHLREHGGGNR